jgi:hypothetical protein
VPLYSYERWLGERTHKVALVHCRDDRITNSLAKEARGDRVELSAMGSGDCLFHILSVF